MNFEFQSTFSFGTLAATTRLAKRLWLKPALLWSAGILVFALFPAGTVQIPMAVVSIIVAAIGSIAVFVALFVCLLLIRIVLKRVEISIAALICLELAASAVYSVIAALIYNGPMDPDASWDRFFAAAAIAFIIVFAAAFVSVLVNITHIRQYFSKSANQKHIDMQTESQEAVLPTIDRSSNKTWIKALTTGVLILIMLIPTVFVSNLVEERQARQEQVKDEVSSKWAGAQTVTFPYLFVPYYVNVQSDGKTIAEQHHFLVLPEELNVTGTVSTEQRQRSIYRVLLYNSNLNAKGNFVIKTLEGVDPVSIDWKAIAICVGISDFKGIQEKVSAKLDEGSYELAAGLPANDIDRNGLSAPVQLSPESIGRQLVFEFPLKLKGSDQLHFVPMAGNSHFVLNSDWNSPSFDGNTLPGERQLSTSGFEANWNFNKANLPFNTTLKEFNFKKDDYAFGVTLLQPTDQYAKTLRCVKYAILFVGLSFSLFFITEVIQKRPFHPVQYILVGIALIVFYTLLLSISEFLLFDIAYLVASAATVLLITSYAKAHFRSWKIAGLFTAVIGFIYAFIFVLIRLEDTALLVGSIGLFIILALAMYASRKVNWYGETLSKEVLA